MRLSLALVLISTMVFAFAPALSAEGTGLWRLELSGGPGMPVGNRDRDDDYLVKGTVEYEIPKTPHLSLGLRLLPFFVYDQNQDDEDTVYGAGAGVGGRMYSVASEYRGLFAELNAHVIGHENRFAGNSSNLNFLTGIGVGYKCTQGWHTVLKWEHISNANLSEHNSGVDVVTLGVGYTF